jgi:hypothetical protein
MSAFSKLTHMLDGEARVEFSRAYAEQNERDYKSLAEAVESGRITAEKGV